MSVAFDDQKTHIKDNLTKDNLSVSVVTSHQEVLRKWEATITSYYMKITSRTLYLTDGPLKLLG
jgi:hypothetical protein